MIWEGGAGPAGTPSRDERADAQDQKDATQGGHREASCPNRGRSIADQAANRHDDAADQADQTQEGREVHRVLARFLVRATIPSTMRATPKYVGNRAVGLFTSAKA